MLNSDTKDSLNEFNQNLPASDGESLFREARGLHGVEPSLLPQYLDLSPVSRVTMIGTPMADLAAIELIVVTLSETNKVIASLSDIMTPPPQALALARAKQSGLYGVLSDGQRTEELAGCGARVAVPANTEVRVSRPPYKKAPLAWDGHIKQRNQGHSEFDYPVIPTAEAAQILLYVRQGDRGTMAGVVTAPKRRITRVAETLSANTRGRLMTLRSEPWRRKSILA